MALVRMLAAVVAVVILSIPWYLAQRDEGVQPYDSGKVVNVVDGDTIDVLRVGRVRLVGVNTPEKDEAGYEEALRFLEEACLGRVAEIDIDDECPSDHFGRILAVVYVDGINLNRMLLQEGHAEVLHLPPSEFDPKSWLDGS
jgi:micrococcal nuclease